MGHPPSGMSVHGCAGAESEQAANRPNAAAAANGTRRVASGRGGDTPLWKARLGRRRDPVKCVSVEIMRATTSLDSYRFVMPLAALLGVCALACGGAKPANTAGGAAQGDAAKGGAVKDPAATGSGGSGATSTGEAGASGGPASGGSTTTALGNGGDLQGAKLGSSSRQEVETKGESGPKPTPGGSSEQGRTVKDIQAIIGARRDDARACYDKGLKDHPGIEGNLDVKWTIDPQGNVANAEVDTTKSAILEPSVGTCVVDVIKKIKFAPSPKGFETRAHYPFDFHPRAGTPKPAPAK